MPFFMHFGATKEVLEKRIWFQIINTKDFRHFYFWIFTVVLMNINNSS